MLGDCAWNLIVLPIIVVPPILFLFQDNEVKGLNWSFGCIDPFKDELASSELGIHVVALK